MNCYVYVLINPNGNTYVGQTQTLDIRLTQHNDPAYRGTLHTKRWPGPWRLLHRENLPDRSHAMRREKELKTGKGRDFIKQLLTMPLASPSASPPSHPV